jgi:hypothetical protein
MIIKSDCNSFACFNYFCKLEMCVRKLQFFSNETFDSLQMDLFKDFLLKIKNFDWLIWNFSAHNKLEQIVIGKDVFLKIWNLFRYLWTKNLGRMLLTATVWVKIINALEWEDSLFQVKLRIISHLKIIISFLFSPWNFLLEN